jgi:ubiquinol-cytochrome c reductase iron-sulfur subunit
MRRLVNLLVAILTLAKLRKARRERLEKREQRIVPAGSADPRAELGVIVLLLVAAVAAVGFVVVYAIDSIPSQTQYEGLTLGVALICIAGALILTGKHLVVTEELEEEYPGTHPEEQEELAQIVEQSGSRFTRKKLLGGAAVVAGGALGAALVSPVASFGPALETHRLLETPWRRGRRLVREDNVPIKASDIEQEAFYTAFAEGASHDLIGAPLVVVRVDPKDLKLPRGRRGWAPQGIVAYSKVCTHAGCPVALYRKTTYPAAQERPALVCPCHYSTFDPAAGGTVLFGPAGRDLPQLPLMIDGQGNLRAAGNFSGPPGPSWWGVRMWKARFSKE